ncbi:hypothetical protein SLEP1_g14816 [Rubroshorea leprosula]|uniref:Uncharacterized protein n=1 Tax=Rubroshorea leprosula TaxID=152421 RepID=A0AAV5IR82_9ROSI|nr:hypothetical protein SLEP1_g14816 [Rubroshorea leprosula]
MKFSDFFSLLVDRKSRGTWLCTLLTVSALLLAIFVIVGSFLAPERKMESVKWELNDNLQVPNNSQVPKVSNCKDQCRPSGSEALPEGIVSKTSNLNMRPLWGFPKSKNTSVSLFALAVGVKQKHLVDKMVRKFLYSGFVVMLFHYDGIVDEWKNLGWSDDIIHVSARNQTKWWFAKRFLHPDIVAEYSYIFLWDEDLGVENFDPKRYLSIIKNEGLQISQPALDRKKSDVHHQITARVRKSTLHRRTFKPGVNGTGCDSKSKAPPCTGWIEMMAPVFSRDAWRCVWYMIQNDLIHAWGLDIQLGYCAQGDRTKNIGIVDAEYIVHYSRPTLGGANGENNTMVQSENENKEFIAPCQAFID